MYALRKHTLLGTLGLRTAGSCAETSGMSTWGVILLDIWPILANGLGFRV